MVVCKYIPTSLLNDVGMYDSFAQLLTNYGLRKFVSMHEHTFVDLNVTQLWMLMLMIPIS